MLDELYARSRETTIGYEDARFAGLLSAMANYYHPMNDYSVWGGFVRALAQELARLEYMYAYDMVTLNPKYLTPPDIKRRWAAPLSVSRTFPYADQDDQSYRAMLVGLLRAYAEGATVQGITDVITAYTGNTIKVEELFRLIGNGIYDETDRNTLRIAVDVSQLNPLQIQATADQIQTLSTSLYNALDLAKPAHVGLDYSLVFGSDESLADIISEFTESVEIELDVVEDAPLENMLVVAPYLQPNEPDTRIAPYGRKAANYFAAKLDTADYNALPSTQFKAMYLPDPNLSGQWLFDSRRLNDVVVLTEEGTPTGDVVTTSGLVGPRLLSAWEIRGEYCDIFELD